VDLRQLGVEFDGLPVFGDGFVPLLLGVQRVAEVIVGLGIFGVEFDGLLECGDGFV